MAGCLEEKSAEQLDTLMLSLVSNLAAYSVFQMVGQKDLSAAGNLDLLWAALTELHWAQQQADPWGSLKADLSESEKEFHLECLMVGL